MDNIKKIKQINGKIFKNENWLISITSYITKRVFLMFFTLFMLGLGYSESNISLYYFALFFSSFAFVYLFNFLKRKEEVLVSLLLIAIMSISMFVIYSNIHFLILSIILFFMFSEVYSVRGMSSIVENSSEKDSNDIVSLSTLYAIIFPAIAFSIVGILSDINKNIYIYFLFAMQIIVATLFFKNYRKIDKSSGFNLAKLNIKIHSHTFTSFLHNSSGFVGKFILLPLMVLQIAKGLGISGGIFSIFGILVGIMCISNLLYNSVIKMKEINYEKMLVDNVIIISIVWILLSVFYIIIGNEDAGKNTIIVISILSLPLVISTDYFSKLWSVGMLNSLKSLSIEEEVEYQKSLFLLNIYKNLGFSFGFLVVFLLSEFIDLPYLIILLSIATIVYCLLFVSKNNEYTSEKYQ